MDMEKGWLEAIWGLCIVLAKVFSFFIITLTHQDLYTEDLALSLFQFSEVPVTSWVISGQSGKEWDTCLCVLWGDLEWFGLAIWVTRWGKDGAGCKGIG